uniref:Ig-like domain-containing protein n=1 Tax=Salmo trutta TaxID=8032 RepID=A0A674CI83_SALTR
MLPHHTSWLGWYSSACKPPPFSSKHNNGHYGQTVLFLFHQTRGHFSKKYDLCPHVQLQTVVWIFYGGFGAVASSLLSGLSGYVNIGLLPTHREATVHQGGEVRWECQAQGVPAPLLSWVLPDRPHPRVSIFPNGTLRIVAVGPADRGLYRCVASNPAGASSLSVRLHVSFLPPAIQQLREERVTQPAGMPVYAHCSARGAPAPSIRWRTPDGTLLLPSQFLNGNLFLSTKDSGSYECLATNAVGGDKRTVRVLVTGDEGGAVGSGSGLSAVITISQSAGRVQSGSTG